MKKLIRKSQNLANTLEAYATCGTYCYQATCPYDDCGGVGVVQTNKYYGIRSNIQSANYSSVNQYM